MRIDLPRSGFGSLVHQIGAYLALAMNTGRVLVLADGSQSHWGIERGARNGHETFFMPLTHCNLTGTSRVEDVRGADVVNVMPTVLDFLKDAPTTMPDTPAREIKYWWRAQASAYILRLNAATSTILKESRGTVCPWAMHVRRGEKAREMTLRPVSKFLASIPRSARSCVFLSTEDDAVVKEVDRVLGSRLVYLDRKRTNADFSTSTQDTAMDIASLWTSLEATRFVGTLGSNWDRLTDELRRVWVGPAPGCCTEFIEVGCETPTCEVDTMNW
jgi:hypothetical protein